MNDANRDERMQRLRGVDLNLFVVFSTVMRERNVTRAAEQLSMSQAAVSAALARLRRILDDPLFVRGQRGVQPTALARRLQDPIDAALAGLHSAVMGDTHFDPATNHALFKIGMSDDLEAVLVPTLVACLGQASPGSALRCLQANRSTITSAIDSGKVDLGVVASDNWTDDYRSRVLFESGYALVYDPTSTGFRGPVSLEHYLRLPHVMISADGTRAITDDLLEAEGKTRQVLVSTAHFAMVPLLLSRTPTVAVMPRHAAEVFAQQFELEVCEPPLQFPRFTISALWHRSRGTDPALMWMIDTIADLTRGIGREE